MLLWGNLNVCKHYQRMVQILVSLLNLVILLYILPRWLIKCYVYDSWDKEVGTYLFIFIYYTIVILACIKLPFSLLTKYHNCLNNVFILFLILTTNKLYTIVFFQISFLSIERSLCTSPCIKSNNDLCGYCCRVSC